MINLLVDECYAFDYLSILQVKRNIDENKNKKAWKDCFDYIKSQLGEEKFTEIIQSLEYNNLYKSNLLTFDAVAKARAGGDISAKEVDDCNMDRYHCKIKLQKAFFPNEDLTEKKL
jgi:hypothetical protein